MKAIAYVRVSTMEQSTQGVSMDAQRKKIEAYCDMQGLDLVSIMTERGVSGGKPLGERPEGEKLLASIARNDIEHVVALKLDRLFRDAEDALHQTKAWDKAGVALHLVDMGGQTVNTGSAMGRFFLNVMAGFAELERNLIAERTEAALQHKKSSNRVYGEVPYGYDRDGDNLRENPEEMQVVREIERLREDGESLRSIAQHLNDSETPTKKGGKWHASTVSSILKNTIHEKENVA